MEAWAVQSNAPTTGTTMDIQHGTVTTTPNAAIHIMTGPTSADSGVNHAVLGFGVSDGTSDFWVSISAQYNVSSNTNVSKGSSSAGCYGKLFSTSQVTDGSCSHNSWLSGGQRLDIDNTFASTNLCSSLFFSTTNAKTMSGTLPDTVDTALNLDPGFEWDCVLVFGVNASGSVNTGDAELYIGFYDKTNQGGFIYSGEDATGGASDSAAMVSNTRVGGRLTPVGDPTVDYTIQASVGSGTSADFTVRTDGGNSETMYALFLGGVQAKVFEWDASTSNGSVSETGVGFQPECGLHLFTFCAAYDTAEGDDDAGAFGIGIDCTGESFCNSYADEYGSNPTDTQCQFYTQSLFTDYDDGSYAYDADITSFDSDGFTYSWTNNEGSVNKFISLMLADADTGTGGDHSASGRGIMRGVARGVG